MSLDVRHARAEDIPRAQLFYAEVGYGGGIQAEDTALLAERDGHLVGIVRLAREGGVVVLRGMQIHPKFRRQDIGTRLLDGVVEVLKNEDCFCIPYAHLVDFYGRIGFVAIEPSRAPSFLRKRLEEYENRGEGKAYVLMHREAPPKSCQEVLNG